MPYIAMSVASAATALLVSDPGSAQGYYLFAIVNSVVYSAVLAAIIIGHARENCLSLIPKTRRGLATAATLAMCLVVTGNAVYSRAIPGLEAVAYGQNVITFTETHFSVAGAGQGGSQVKITRFKIKWHGIS